MPKCSNTHRHLLWWKVQALYPTWENASVCWSTSPIAPSCSQRKKTNASRGMAAPGSPHSCLSESRSRSYSNAFDRDRDRDRNMTVTVTVTVTTNIIVMVIVTSIRLSRTLILGYLNSLPWHTFVSLCFLCLHVALHPLRSRCHRDSHRDVHWIHNMTHVLISGFFIALHVYKFDL
jgi:hypothetical protein